MRKRNPIAKRKILIYFAIFLMACCYLYINSSNESQFFSNYHTMKSDINSTTFIFTNYSEDNGVVRLDGQFDNNLLRGIQVLAIRNASFLSRKFLLHVSSNKHTNNKTTVIVHPSKQLEHETSKKQHKTKTNRKVTKQGVCSSFNSYTLVRDSIPAEEKKGFQDWTFFEQRRTVEKVNCKLLFQNNAQEINKSITLTKKRPFIEIPPSNYTEKTKHCEKFVRESGYITSSLTDEEEDFPIAYSLLVFKGVQQVERLLRAIYRPQNVYCIHVDKKSEDDFTRAVHGIASCFENVFISSKSFKVVWGEIGVLLPEIACMSDLWKHKKWKYFINLTGQEFPLRTNLELVRILRALNGANAIDGTIKRMNKDRFENAPKAPHGIRPVKGSAHILASRGYVDFILHNKIATDFLNWTRDVKIPDETFFASLNHNPQLQIPGTYKGDPDADCETKPFITRFKNWGSNIYNWPCHGSFVRSVCVFGVGDLPLLAARQELFANKFYLHGQTHAYMCMEELIFNRTRDEYFGTLQFDTRHYESLGFIKNSV